MTTKEAALFQRELVAKGLTKEAAQRAWIARARGIIEQRTLPASDHTE